MKTLLFVLAATATTALAQQPVTMIEYGPQALQMHRQSNADIQAALNQLLEKSEAQLDSLNTLVQRQGDYLAANRDSVTRAQDAILSNTLTTTKTTAELMAERANASGSDLFQDSANGVFKGIGATYEKKVTDAAGNTTTETANRSAESYTEEAMRLKDITEFYRVRDASLEKQKALELARMEAHIALISTEDQVETQRLTAQISTIDAELIAVRQDVANATHELEVHEKAIQVQSIADAKAQMENLGRDSGSMMQNVEAMQQRVQEAVDAMRAGAEERAAAGTGRGRLP
ncbi:MAG: hypothetical protein KDK99_09470 [Verrucomicrobiales bacterium]|nr:hypothetical protein [Verrucomicrobiales bacterium]